MQIDNNRITVSGGGKDANEVEGKRFDIVNCQSSSTLKFNMISKRVLHMVTQRKMKDAWIIGGS